MCMRGKDLQLGFRTAPVFTQRIGSRCLPELLRLSGRLRLFIGNYMILRLGESTSASSIITRIKTCYY